MLLGGGADVAATLGLLVGYFAGVVGVLDAVVAFDLPPDSVAAPAKARRATPTMATDRPRDVPDDSTTLVPASLAESTAITVNSAPSSIAPHDEQKAEPAACAWPHDGQGRRRTTLTTLSVSRPIFVSRSVITRDHESTQHWPTARSRRQLYAAGSQAVPSRAQAERRPCRAVPCRAVPCRAVPCRAVPSAGRVRGAPRRGDSATASCLTFQNALVAHQG